MSLSIGIKSNVVHVLKYFLGFFWEFISVYRNVYHECRFPMLFISFKCFFCKMIDRL